METMRDPRNFASPFSAVSTDKDAIPAGHEDDMGIGYATVKRGSVE